MLRLTRATPADVCKFHSFHHKMGDSHYGVWGIVDHLVVSAPPPAVLPVIAAFNSVYYLQGTGVNFSRLKGHDLKQCE